MINEMKVDIPTKEVLDELTVSLILDDGKEYPSAKKMFIEGDIRPPTLKEQIQRILRTELSRSAQEQGFESFEESNDFDVLDDFDKEPESAYEFKEMEEEVIKEPEIEPETNVSGEVQEKEEAVEK